MKIIDKNPACGVYAIWNKRNGKLYVGSALNTIRRCAEHLKALRKGKHHSSHLQRAWNIDGEEGFFFKLINTIAKEELLHAEQYWIDFFMSADDGFGYNICPRAGSRIGSPVSEDTRRKLVAWHTGKTLSADHKAAISRAGRGRKLSDETKARMSATQKGYGGGRAKLSGEKVREIRRLIASGVMHKIIAKQFGVARNTIGNVATGHRWKHVPQDS